MNTAIKGMDGYDQDFNKKYSNKLMRLRVLIQGIIVLIFSIVLIVNFLK